MTSAFVRFYEAIVRAGDAFSSYLVLAMRLYWGFLFYQAGMYKFTNFPQAVLSFHGLGIPFAEANVNIVASFEVAGGVLIMLGLASRLVSIPLAVILLTAYATAHRAALLNVFSDPGAFMSQSPYNFLVMCLVVFSFGPGKFSLDYLIGRKK